jgi:hypothetical protein
MRPRQNRARSLLPAANAWSARDRHPDRTVPGAGTAAYRRILLHRGRCQASTNRGTDERRCVRAPCSLRGRRSYLDTATALARRGRAPRAAAADARAASRRRRMRRRTFSVAAQSRDRFAGPARARSSTDGLRRRCVAAWRAPPAEWKLDRTSLRAPPDQQRRIADSREEPARR